MIKILIIAVIGLVAISIIAVLIKDTDPKDGAVSLTLEEQIEKLRELGIRLNDEITVDDLLYSFDREAYEEKPFDLILFMYGSEVEREPWGRKISDIAWNFDLECIEGNGSYIEIVKQFALIANKTKNISEIEDSVDFEAETAWISYKIDGVYRKYEARVDSDWADPEVISLIIKDLESESHKFYAKDNGQAAIWFYLNKETAGILNKYSGNALKLN